jgi:2Fe-2S ferredoxin
VEQEQGDQIMPKISIVDSAGNTVVVNAQVGLTVMEVAVDNNIAGIVAECGGACACATCHAYIDEAWLDRLPAMDDMEDAMLDSVLDRRPNSRLSCQIEIADELDGLVLTAADNDA